MNKHDDTFYTDEFLDLVMGMKGIPDYLYHYTSIDALTSVLNNATIRFNRLDRVNDAEEAKANDLPNSNTSQFVSCWGEDPIESIPLWHMYSQQMNGVRIRMPVNMFLGRPQPKVYDRGGCLTSLKTPYLIERVNNNFSVTSTIAFGPNPIYYSDDSGVHHPSILHDIGDPYKENIPHVRVSPIDLGCVKSKDWEFEKEWRFKLSLFNIGEIFPLDEVGKVKLDLVNNAVITRFIDIDVDPSAFQEMEVLLGPKHP